ncbi:hypothetical protein ACM66B_004701 [Microbotryomycetes sp. NB124-2]
MPSSSAGSSRSTAPHQSQNSSAVPLERSLTASSVQSGSSSSRRHLRTLGSGPSHRQQARLGVTTDYTDLSLHSAAANGNLGLVRYALQQGQPVNSVLSGVLPLHAAASSGSLAIVKELIEYGADVNAPRLSRRYSHDRSRSSGMAAGTTGSTALHFAAANGHADVVSILLEFGADPSAEEKYGLTPEMVATQRGHFEAASLLRQAQIEQADRAAASAASGSVVKSLAKKRIHPQRSFDALAVKLQQHASQPHLPSSLHMTSSSSLNSQATLAGASVVRRLSAPNHVKDLNAPRRPSLPSVFEKAAHPSSTLKQALGLSSKRSTDAKSLASDSRTSLSSTLLGRNRSNSVIQDDEQDLAELDEEFGSQADGFEPEREQLFRPPPSTTTAATASGPLTASGPSIVGRRLSSGQASSGTARADQFYRPRHSSQLSGRTSVANSSPSSPRVFAEDDEDGTGAQHTALASGQGPPSRSASLRAPDSSQPSTPYLSTSEMSSSKELTVDTVDSSDKASTTSRSTFDASQRPRASEPRLGAATASQTNDDQPKPNATTATSQMKALNVGVDNVKRVTTRAGRSDSVGTDGRFSSSAASSYSGPGTLSTYAPTVSTTATSIHPGTQGTAAKSTLSPLYESAAGPSSAATSSITTSAQARSRVKKAERDLLTFNASSDTSGSGSTNRASLTQKLAAYGQTLALERKLAAMEMSSSSSSLSASKQASPFKYETIGTSVVKPFASTSRTVVTAEPAFDSSSAGGKPIVPQWRAVPTTDRLGPPTTVHTRHRVPSPSGQDKNALGGNVLHAVRKNGEGVQTVPVTDDEPVVFGLNPNAPKGPVSYVQARAPPTKPDASAIGGISTTTTNGNGHDKHKGASAGGGGGGGGGTSSRRSDRTHSNKGTSGNSVTSARDQVELDAIEQSRMEQAVPKAQITVNKDAMKGKSGKKGTTHGSSAGSSGFKKLFGR